MPVLVHSVIIVRYFLLMYANANKKLVSLIFLSRNEASFQSYSRIISCTAQVEGILQMTLYFFFVSVSIPPSFEHHFKQYRNMKITLLISLFEYEGDYVCLLFISVFKP